MLGVPGEAAALRVEPTRDSGRSFVATLVGEDRHKRARSAGEGLNGRSP